MSSPWYHNPPESATIPVMKTQKSHALIVVTVALLVRGLYLWQTASSPFFGEPLVERV